MTPNSSSANSSFGAIHEATVDKGAVTERTVLQNTSGDLTGAIGSLGILLVASTAGYAVVDLPRAGQDTQDNGPQPATLDLNTGTLRAYDIGPGETVCFLRSPDPKKLLVCQWSGITQTTEILDLTSGAVKAVAELNGLTGKPISRMERGIITSSCNRGEPCTYGGASVLDPQTSDAMRIAVDGYVTAVSPSGSFLGVTKNMDQGSPPLCNDSVYSFRMDWTRVASEARQGSQSPLISQPNKDFKVLHIADDGSVLYTESDCPPNGHSPPSPTSLYYFSGGRSTLQPGLGENQDVFYLAAPQSGGLLLSGGVAVVAGRPNGISELNLVHLCTSDGCQPAVTTIAQGDPSVEGYAFSVVP